MTSSSLIVPSIFIVILLSVVLSTICVCTAASALPSVIGTSFANGNKFGDVKIDVPKQTKPGDIMIIFIGGSGPGGKRASLPSPPLPTAGWAEITDRKIPSSVYDVNLKAYHKTYKSDDDTEKYTIKECKSKFVSIVSVRGVDRARLIVDAAATLDSMPGSEGASRAPSVRAEDGGIVLAAYAYDDPQRAVVKTAGFDMLLSTDTISGDGMAIAVARANSSMTNLNNGTIEVGPIDAIGCKMTGKGRGGNEIGMSISIRAAAAADADNLSAPDGALESNSLVTFKPMLRSPGCDDPKNNVGKDIATFDIATDVTSWPPTATPTTNRPTSIPTVPPVTASPSYIPTVSPVTASPSYIPTARPSAGPTAPATTSVPSHTLLSRGSLCKTDDECENKRCGIPSARHISRSSSSSVKICCPNDASINFGLAYGKTCLVYGAAGFDGKTFGPKVLVRLPPPEKRVPKDVVATMNVSPTSRPSRMPTVQVVNQEKKQILAYNNDESTIIQGGGEEMIEVYASQAAYIHKGEQISDNAAGIIIIRKEPRVDGVLRFNLPTEISQDSILELALEVMTNTSSAIFARIWQTFEAPEDDWKAPNGISWHGLGEKDIRAGIFTASINNEEDGVHESTATLYSTVHPVNGRIDLRLVAARNYGDYALIGIRSKLLIRYMVGL